MEWQPIETAPKNEAGEMLGPTILIYYQADELPSPALGGKQTLLKKRMCGVSTSIWGRQLHLAAPCLSPPLPRQPCVDQPARRSAPSGRTPPMTNPNHTDTSRSGDLVARLRDKWDGGLVEPILDAIEAGEYRNG